MEAARWRGLSLLPLPRSLRRLLLFGVPSLVLLALVGLAGWKWASKRRGRLHKSEQPSHPQLEREQKSRVEESGAPFGQRETSITRGGFHRREAKSGGAAGSFGAHQPLGYHSNTPPELPPHLLQRTAATGRPHQASSSLPNSHGQPRKTSTTSVHSDKHSPRGGTSSLASKYPTASSDLQSESFSELESISSSEELSLQNFKSPPYRLDSNNPSPALENRSSISELVGNPIQRSTLANSSLHSPKTDPQSPDSGIKSTPLLPQSSAQRVKITIQIPKDLVGRFIGKQGRNIKALMLESNGAHVYVNQRNLPTDPMSVPCYIQGSTSQVDEALKIISSKFPEIDPPDLVDAVHCTPISPLFGSPPPDREMWMTELRPATVPSSPFHAVVTYIESLNRVWLVAYSSNKQLEELHQSMSYYYSYIIGSSSVPHVEEGDLVGKHCAVKVSDIHWLRGHVTKLSDEGVNFEVRLVDYGSTVIVPPTAIKPLR